ncbi:MAG: PocR ligand-binding domain-containing protein, partial [Candidatus Hydrogenedentes bacterium]|nr:PocR ligand-binding domain-containing protein [Candidatus Hydrogenedentota bacterium]
MTPLAFFRGAEVRRLLERAAEAAGMPLSLHYVEHGEEGPKMAAWGGCATCAYVAGLPEGKRACRESRLAASLDALAQGRGLPFLCHMGFACVAAPA